MDNSLKTAESPKTQQYFNTMQMIIDAFNKKYPVGTFLYYQNEFGTTVPTEIRKPAQINGIYPVVYIRGFKLPVKLELERFTPKEVYEANRNQQANKV